MVIQDWMFWCSLSGLECKTETVSDRYTETCSLNWRDTESKNSTLGVLSRVTHDKGVYRYTRGVSRE